MDETSTQIYNFIVMTNLAIYSVQTLVQPQLSNQPLCPLDIKATYKIDKNVTLEPQLGVYE